MPKSAVGATVARRLGSAPRSFSDQAPPRARVPKFEPRKAVVVAGLSRSLRPGVLYREDPFFLPRFPDCKTSLQLTYILSFAILLPDRIPMEPT
jgi:hypothetical protein